MLLQKILCQTPQTKAVLVMKIKSKNTFNIVIIKCFKNYCSQTKLSMNAISTSSKVLDNDHDDIKFH